MHSQIAAFARLANGLDKPVRNIYGEPTHLTRTVHDIRYNEVDDEIVVPVTADAILTFRGGATGQEPPIRIIQGPKTQVGGDRLDIDVVHREIYGLGGGGIVVHSLDANGDVAPLRVLRGAPGFRPSSSVAVDPIHNLLATVGGGGRSILIFDRMASGNAMPLRVIEGANTQIDRINQMTIYPAGKLLVVAMPGIQSYMAPPRFFVGMWSLDDDGDVAPKFAIAGDKTLMGKTFGVAVNPDQKEIHVSDMRRHGILAYSVPEAFEPVAASTGSR